MNTPLEGRVLLITGMSLTLVGTAMLLAACSSHVDRFDEPRPKRPKVIYARPAPVPEVRVEPEPLLRCRSQSCIEQCAEDNTAKPKWCSGFEPQPKSRERQ